MQDNYDPSDDFLVGSRVPSQIAAIEILCHDIRLAKIEAGHQVLHQNRRSLDFQDLTLDQLRGKLVESARKLIWFIDNEGKPPPY
jgi:hypothetical protein